MSADYPSDRALIGRLAAHVRWATCEDRTAATAVARAAFEDRFAKQVDPDGTLTRQDRAARAKSAKTAYFTRLALKSAQVRRARAKAKAPAA